LKYYILFQPTSYNITMTDHMTTSNLNEFATTLWDKYHEQLPIHDTYEWNKCILLIQKVRLNKSLNLSHMMNKWKQSELKDLIKLVELVGETIFVTTNYKTQHNEDNDYDITRQYKDLELNLCHRLWMELNIV